MKNPELAGKTALVTGGGSGIGRATARRLALCGADVVIVGRRRDRLDAVANEIGSGCRALVADIARDEDVRRLFAQVDVIDILINNAGTVAPIDPVHLADPAAWLANIDINLNAVFLTMRYALPAMLQRGWGRIVNISSGAARGGTTGWGAYSAAKAGVETLTKIVAAEVADGGIRVNALRPGVVDTEMQSEIRATPEERFGRENLEKFRGYHARGVLRDPNDPATLILWLLSPEADQINGEVLSIDDPEVAARIGVAVVTR